MSNDVNPIHPSSLRAFVLDQLEAAARETIEARVLTDEDLFAQLRETEDDLVDAYVRGMLDPATRDRLESTLLAAPDGKMRLAVAQDLRQRSEAQATHEDEGTKAAVPSSPRLWRLAIAAMLLLAWFAGWLGMRAARLGEQVDQLTEERMALATDRQQWATERETLTQAVEAAQDHAEKLASEVTSRAADIETLSERLRALAANSTERIAKAPLTVALALGLGVRGQGAPTLAVPTTATTISLQIDLESDAVFQHYRAVLSGSRGVQVWTQDDLDATTKAWGAQITLNVPAEVLPAGRYELAVRGHDGADTPEEVGFYPFAIARR